MSTIQPFLKGVIHGKRIELEIDAGLPEGQQVAVILQPMTEPERWRGDGIRQSAGGWGDAGDEFDAWLAEMQRSRQKDRRELQ